jgi:hypothetical protein
MHRDNLTISWSPLLSHSSTTITSCFSLIIHGPMSQGSLHNSWKLKMSHFFPLLAHSPDMSNIEHVCDALINMYDTVFQFPPISSNFAQPLKRSGTTFHSLINSMRRRCVTLQRQIVVATNTDWFSDLYPHLFLWHLWPIDANLYSQSCEIHRLVPNEFISIDWLLNCNLETQKCCKLRF